MNKLGGLDVILCLIMVGACLGFLVYNFNPASIFMGYTGSMFLGFIISVIALLGFKTATITLHCQPFKYPLEEEPIEAEIITMTGTGETITLNNTEEAPMKINLKGNTSQAGTPTPETPQDIHIVSGDNSINVFDKNLFNPTLQNNGTNIILNKLTSKSEQKNIISNLFNLPFFTQIIADIGHEIFKNVLSTDNMIVIRLLSIV